MFALRALAAAALLVTSTTPFADTLNGGTVSTPDPVAENLFGLHLLDGAGFVDSFDFNVTGSGIAAATMQDAAFDLSGNPGSAPFTFVALVLADASNAPLDVSTGVDVDGTNGWTVTAALPGAGTYRVLLQGTAPLSATDPSETQVYAGVLRTQVTPVPEPATYGLMALGLLALAGLRRRR